MSLLGYQNAKTSKGEDLGFLTGILYLAPSDLSGVDLCPKASEGCRAACLYTAGRGAFKSIQDARMKKTKYFLEKPKDFYAELVKEIGAASKKAARLGYRLAVRLNGTSDIVIESKFKGLFEQFPEVQFYDYTKIAVRFKRPRASNYSLTFSRSESNEAEAIEVLRNGGNVAVVFDVKKGQDLPETWHGFPVLDGDLHDARFLDPKGGFVVGLRAKGKARKDSSGFVVEVPK